MKKFKLKKQGDYLTDHESTLLDQDEVNKEYPPGDARRYRSLADAIAACETHKYDLKLDSDTYSISATLTIDGPLIMRGVGCNTGVTAGSIIDNTTADVVAISVTGTGVVQRTQLRDFGITHSAANKFAVVFNDGAAYGQIDNVVINCNSTGYGGVLFGDESASTAGEAWQAVVNNLRVDDATDYGIRVNTTGHTLEFRNCSPRSSVNGAHGIYINSRNVHIYGGQYGANNTGGIPIYFHNIDSTAHYRGSVNDCVFENVDAGEYAIVIDGTTYGFNKVQANRVGIQLSTNLGTLIKFGRTSESILNLPSILAPTGGGYLAEWGANSVDCSVIVDLDGAKAPVTVSGSATRPLKIVVGRVALSAVANITTATNLTVILRDGIVELPGIIPVHNGVSWNYEAQTPAQITANTDNYNPTGLGHNFTFRLSTDASRNLTGIVAQAAGTRMLLCNVGSFDLVLVHAATSTAANRFFCPGSVNLTLHPNDSVELEYDGTSARWRVLTV